MNKKYFLNGNMANSQGKFRSRNTALNRYKWVRSDLKESDKNCMKLHATSAKTSNSHVSNSGDGNSKSRGTHQPDKIKDKRRRVVLECKTIIARLDAVMKQVKSMETSSGKRTSESESAPAISPEKTNPQKSIAVETCKKCAANRLRNPYQYVKCSCYLDTKRVVSGTSQPSVDTVLSHTNRKDVKNSDTCINMSSKHPETEVSTLQSKSTVSSVNTLSSKHAANIPKVAKLKSYSSPKCYAVKTRYRLDRRAKSEASYDYAARKGHFLKNEKSSDRHSTASISSVGSGSVSTSLKSRYQIDRRQKVLTRRKGVADVNPVLKDTWKKKLQRLQRRDTLRKEGFIVSHYKMRRRSWSRSKEGVTRQKQTNDRTTPRHLSRQLSRSSLRIVGTPPSAMTGQRFYKQAIDRAKYCLVNRKRPYCSQFIRTGKCKNRSSCRYIHDLKTIRLCPRFLKGGCDEPLCQLCHKKDPDRMPLCLFFENGVCSRGSDCPFRHVKLPSNTPVCTSFQWSYCPLGAKCPQRHVLGTRSFVRKQPPSDDPVKSEKSEETTETEHPKAFESDSFLPLLSDTEDEEDLSEEDSD